jgi:hypothetical protein
LRRLVHAAAPSHELREHMRLLNVPSLRDEGIQLALDGKTSLDEILRVTHDDETEAAPPAPKAHTPLRPDKEVA